MRHTHKLPHPPCNGVEIFAFSRDVFLSGKETDHEFRGFCLERLFGQTLFRNTKEGLIRKFAGDMLKWFWSASIVKGVKITLDVKEKPLRIEFLRIACFEFLFCARSCGCGQQDLLRVFATHVVQIVVHQTWIFDLLWWELIQTHRVRINTGNAVFRCF